MQACTMDAAKSKRRGGIELDLYNTGREPLLSESYHGVKPPLYVAEIFWVTCRSGEIETMYGVELAKEAFL